MFVKVRSAMHVRKCNKYWHLQVISSDLPAGIGATCHIQLFIPKGVLKAF